MDLEVRAFLPPPTETCLMSAMDSISDTTRRMLEIEARQDEVLRELAALERRLEQVLAECLPLTANRPIGVALPPSDAA